MLQQFSVEWSNWRANVLRNGSETSNVTKNAIAILSTVLSMDQTTVKKTKKNTVTLHIPYINFMHQAITAVDIMIKHLAQFKVALTEALFFAFVKYI